MRQYGLAVHEAAAFVIARRGMGYKEKVPYFLRKYIPIQKLGRHHWSHWASLHKQISEINWKRAYRKFPGSEPYDTLKKYTDAYMFA